MDKKEIRVQLHNNSKAGNWELEMDQLRQLQEGRNSNAINTITAGCCDVLTIICC